MDALDVCDALMGRPRRAPPGRPVGAHGAFTLFRRLPPELRAAIWRLAFEPRILRINVHARDGTAEQDATHRDVVPVVAATPGLARATQTRRDLLRTCLESRAEMLRFMPDALPLAYVKERRVIRLPYHRRLDLICYQHVSHLVMRGASVDPAGPPMSFPVESIAFDEDFVEAHFGAGARAGPNYTSIGPFLEMMPTVKRIYVVNASQETARGAYPFRIMTTKGGNWITLNQEPRINHHVWSHRHFYSIVDTGQEFCHAIREHDWRGPQMAQLDMTVFVMSPGNPLLEGGP
ncbi:hypothetical protein GQ53DRAFT_460915 [Thozetella sp. PMI_491]|nr:hypothetical protein GQ53DRAFT_460915 [Thozetella sp. PMI_491]